MSGQAAAKSDESDMLQCGPMGGEAVRTAETGSAVLGQLHSRQLCAGRQQATEQNHQQPSLTFHCSQDVDEVTTDPLQSSSAASVDRGKKMLPALRGRDEVILPDPLPTSVGHIGTDTARSPHVQTHPRIGLLGSGPINGILGENGSGFTLVVSAGRRVPGEFWLSDLQWARLAPLLPNKPWGVPRVDDRQVVSGIVHVLRSGAAGLMLRRSTARARPCTTALSGGRPRKGVWQAVFEALAAAGGPPAVVLLDSPHVKANRCAVGEPGLRHQALGIASADAPPDPRPG